MQNKKAINSILTHGKTQYQNSTSDIHFFRLFFFFFLLLITFSSINYVAILIQTTIYYTKILKDVRGQKV
jgi:hypothetical protein